MSRLFTLFALLLSIAIPIQNADPLQKCRPQAPVHLQHLEWSNYATHPIPETRQIRFEESLHHGRYT